MVETWKKLGCVSGWVTSFRDPKREDAAWPLLFWITISREMDQKKYGPYPEIIWDYAILHFFKFQTLKNIRSTWIRYELDIMVQIGKGGLMSVSTGRFSNCSKMCQKLSWTIISSTCRDLNRDDWIGPSVYYRLISE